MSGWIHIEDRRPLNGQFCKVIDPFDKEDFMYYQEKPEITIRTGETIVVGRDLFYNTRGWLTDDVLYWKPAETKIK